jgi:hypothetical protein
VQTSASNDDGSARDASIDGSPSDAADAEDTAAACTFVEPGCDRAGGGLFYHCPPGRSPPLGAGTCVAFPTFDADNYCCE